MSKVRWKNSESFHISEMMQNAIAGGTAGAVSRVTTAPLDVLKIRLQLEGGKRNQRYNGIVNTVKSVYFEEGIKGFWRGGFASIALWITYVGTQFCLYSTFRKVLCLRKAKEKERISSNDTLDKFVAGAGAGTFATAITYPLDILRTAFAGQGVPKKHPSMPSFFVSTYKTYGIKGFYAGLSPALLLVAPQMGLTFVCYESILSSSPENIKALPGFSHWWPATAGFVSGLLSKTAVYPLDTLKKRVQAMIVLDSEGMEGMHCVKAAVEQMKGEGLICSFYRGMVPALWKASLSTAVTFGTYEWVKESLSPYSNS
eukprot:CAMPEP_0171452344 /NCGR_PEP_ID=MMETSP0945-20130129/492_1 /TAXON_ID=109269 /ORGANISM="Vaucheria litorea, Strain CCMP2940" /LENGTH=313 /DNA_ID=CAMNT_0011976997 /DNA_START=28 /DNA_END=969 /DNA_ORIENTATION=+